LTRAARRRAAVALLAAAWSAGSVAARAQTSPSPAALAESLFQEGKSLMENGAYEKACPKLAESQRLDPATGTLLALALCHEGEGKTATAWSEFNEVAGAAKRDGRADREKLEANLSRLAVQVDPQTAALPGLEVKVDGIPLGKAAWGAASPADPGEHVIDASAPGRRPWSVTVALGRRADKRTVTVSLPSGEGDATPPAAEQEEPSTGGDPKRTVGVVTVGAGAIVLGVGLFFGAQALSKNGDAKALCDPNACSSAQGLSLNEEARSSAGVANVAIGVGLVAVAIGVYLYATSSPSTTSGVSRAGGPLIRF
jgi:hypothetical protein